MQFLQGCTRDEFRLKQKLCSDAPRFGMIEQKPTAFCQAPPAKATGADVNDFQTAVVFVVQGQKSKTVKDLKRQLVS